MSDPILAAHVVCPCGRYMTEAPRYGPHWFACGCGAGVRVQAYQRGGVQLSPDVCQVWRNGKRCGNRIHRPASDKAPGGMVCTHCQYDIVENALLDPDTHDRLRDSFAAEDINQARRRVAREQAERDETERREREQQARERRELEHANAVHVVYYVRLGENHIKIGTTTRLAERMTELRVANHANLLAAEPGDRTVEANRHRTFNILRYDQRKEDFRESPRLLQHIDTVRGQWGDPWRVADVVLAQREGTELPSG